VRDAANDLRTAIDINTCRSRDVRHKFRDFPPKRELNHKIKREPSHAFSFELNICA